MDPGLRRDDARVFMEFLYLRPLPRLENLCARWHFILHRRRHCWASRHPLLRKECPMLDLLMLALGLGFFVLTVGYAYACERL